MSEKILVVDDDAYIRRILERRLSGLGYTVLLSEDGEKGLSLAKEHSPDLIVSDWMMPKMDGLELCKRVKEDLKLRYSYFIILTAKDTEDDKIEGIEKGADDFLTKPFNDRELVTRIRAGLRISALQKELIALQHTRAITELAITTGHEINNPLGIVMLSLQLMERKNDSAPIREIRKEIETCMENGKRIAEIVRKLSRLQVPQMKPYLKNSDIDMIDLTGDV
jgi:DNA-binding response OmpR family regulator